jgi:hypothetical protein
MKKKKHNKIVFLIKLFLKQKRNTSDKMQAYKIPSCLDHIKRFKLNKKKIKKLLIKYLWYFNR